MALKPGVPLFGQDGPLTGQPLLHRHEFLFQPLQVGHQGNGPRQFRLGGRKRRQQLVRLGE